MLHRTGTRKLHTAKQLNPTQARKSENTTDNANTAAASNGAKKVNIGITLVGHGLTQLNWIQNEKGREDAIMKQALMDMDGTIINSSGPTFGDYMAKRYI